MTKKMSLAKSIKGIFLSWRRLRDFLAQCVVVWFALGASVAWTAADAYYFQSAQVAVEQEHGRVAIKWLPGTAAASSGELAQVHPCIDSTVTPVNLPNGIVIYGVCDSCTHSAICASLLGDTSVSRVMPCYSSEEGAELIHVTDDISVEFVNGITVEEMHQVLCQYGLVFKDSNEFDHGQWLCEFSDTARLVDPIAISAQLHEDPLTQWACPDFALQIETSALPADEYFSNQYYLRDTAASAFDIDIEYAWEFRLFDSSIIVAVIDEGFNEHFDLPASRFVPGYDFAGNINDPTIPQHDPPDDDPSPGPNRYHGIACAGIIAAEHNEFGIAGVIGSCRVMPIKIFYDNRPAASAEQIAKAIEWACQSGARVLSNSWADASKSQYSERIVQALQNAQCPERFVVDTCESGIGGAVVVFGTGNQDDTVAGDFRIQFPAGDSSVLAVGAVTRQGIRAAYSRYLAASAGQSVDVVAPSNSSTLACFQDVWTLAGC